MSGPKGGTFSFAPAIDWELQRRLEEERRQREEELRKRLEQCKSQTEKLKAELKYFVDKEVYRWLEDEDAKETLESEVKAIESLIKSRQNEEAETRIQSLKEKIQTYKDESEKKRGDDYKREKKIGTLIETLSEMGMVTTREDVEVNLEDANVPYSPVKVTAVNPSGERIMVDVGIEKEVVVTPEENEKCWNLVEDMTKRLEKKGLEMKISKEHQAQSKKTIHYKEKTKIKNRTQVK